MRPSPSASSERKTEFPKKLGRKERARLRASQEGYVWGERPPEYGPAGYRHDKLVKMWAESPLDEDVKALLLLMEGKISWWWDPLARGWGVCQATLRFAHDVAHRTIPHNGGIRRWQFELSAIMRETQISTSEW